MNLIPNVIEKENGEIRSLDLYSRLLDDRIIMLDDEVSSQSASLVKAQLLYLDAIAPGKDIYLYINSPGGSVIDGLAIIDTMNSISSDVVTIASGLAASMAAVILAAGTPGKRFAQRHASIMIHNPLTANPQRKLLDAEASIEHAKRLRSDIFDIMAKACSKTSEQIDEAGRIDHYMSSQDAINFGLIDKISE